MEQRQSKDFLIRNIPIEVYYSLEQVAKEHHRSKNQEALVALTQYLSMYNHPIKKPVPFKWKKKVSSNFIEKAINEGREDDYS